MSSPALKTAALANHELIVELLKTILACLILFLAVRWLWHEVNDIYAVLYCTLCLVLIILKTFRWPSVSWLGGCGLKSLSQNYAERRLNIEPENSRVSTLAEQRLLSVYCAAQHSLVQSKDLCEGIGRSLTPRIIVYAILSFIYVVIAGRGGTSHASEWEILARSQILLIAGTIPLIWDGAKCEWQAHWNRKVAQRE